MQRNVRGAYICLEHDRQADWDWLAKWQPNVIRYMGQGNINDPNSFDVNRVRRIYETCPDATILLRCWNADDNNFKAHDAMVADPRGTAERQVDWWTRVIDRAGAIGVPRSLLMAGLNNETGPEKDASLYPYSAFALEFATPRAVRLGVLVFSVGRPSLAGESQYDIPYFSRLDNAILANKGAVVLHQYMQPEGMYAVWTDQEGNERKDYGYLIGRDLHWKIQSPIIIGEWGIDGILYNRHPDPVYGNSGWRNFKAEWPPSRYADEYVACVQTCSPNVIATCPFLSDFSDHKWQSFDLLDAYEEFLARKDRCVREDAPTQPDTPPHTVHIPSVGTGKPTSTIAYVIAKAGANLRTAPITGQVITAIPYGDEIRILGVMDTSGWLYVQYGDAQGYMAASLVGLTAPVVDDGPEPVEPMPAPEGSNNWAHAWPIVLQIEGGLSTDRNDPGNYRPDGTFVGTRWGISANAHPTVDIVNLSKEDALKIYYRDYWVGGGCDRLPWPLCLLHFDAYVQNQSAAKKFLAASNGDPDLYLAERIDWYTTVVTWNHHGRGWMRRCATMLREVAKAK